MQPNYLNYIEDADMDDTASFVGPFMLTMICEDAERNKFVPAYYEGTDVLHGLLLFKRILVNTSTIICLDPINAFLEKLKNALSGGTPQEVVDFLIENIAIVSNKVNAQLVEAADNIELTTEHIKEYCDIHNIDFSKTPYAQ